MDIAPVAQGSLKYLSFASYKLTEGQEVRLEAVDSERAIIVLGGLCDLRSSVGNFLHIGGRSGVFDELGPNIVIFPRGEGLSLRSIGDSHIISTNNAEVSKGEPIHISPDRMRREERGTGNRLRYVRHLVPKDVQTNLVLFEVYTPGGNWSSFPPHRHDRIDPPRENLLEEFYYYQFNPATGFALQRNFDLEAGYDEAIAAKHGTLVPVSRGYHTVSAAPGGECYYFNVMAGPKSDWTFKFHPDLEHLQEYGSNQ